MRGTRSSGTDTCGPKLFKAAAEAALAFYSGHRSKRVSQELELRFPPRSQIHTVENNAEEVGRDKAPLRCPYPNDADQDAVERRQRPAFPISPSYQNR